MEKQRIPEEVTIWQRLSAASMKSVKKSVNRGLEGQRSALQEAQQSGLSLLSREMPGIKYTPLIGHNDVTTRVGQQTW